MDAQGPMNGPYRLQAQGRMIVNGGQVFNLQGCKITLRWVPSHKGIPGNEVTDAMAKEVAKEPGRDNYSRQLAKMASFTYLAWRTMEIKSQATKNWIQERTHKAYILRKKSRLRKNLKHEKRATAARFYQLLSGHAITAPYLKEKLKKGDTDVCWWCESGKRQTREHLFKECARWKREIKDLWWEVGKEVGWRRAKWKSISRLFAEEKAEKSILEFIRKMGVGKKNGETWNRREPEEEEEESEEGEEAD
jgi:hypothetical protein